MKFKVGDELTPSATFGERSHHYKITSTDNNAYTLIPIHNLTSIAGEPILWDMKWTHYWILHPEYQIRQQFNEDLKALLE